MRALATLLLLLIAGCSTPDPVPADEVLAPETDPDLPSPLLLDGTIGLGNPLLASGPCPQTGECVIHPFALDRPLTMRVDLEVTSGELHWGLYHAGQERGSARFTGAWQAERHLAAGDYQIVLQNYGAVEVELTGTVSWYQAFSGNSSVEVPVGIQDEGTWAAGRADRPFYDGCDGCMEYPFSVLGEGYDPVDTHVSLSWDQAASMGALQVRLGEEVIAQTPYNLLGDTAVLDAGLFPGDYVLQVAGAAPVATDWRLHVTFD